MTAVVQHLQFQFAASPEIVYEHLILHRDYSKWADLQDVDISDVRVLLEDGRYVGFSGPPLILGGGRLVAMVDICEPPKLVRYKPIRFDAPLVGAKKQNSFPFTTMTQELQFHESAGKCVLHHKTTLEARGVLGWLLCRLFVLPASAKSQRRNYVRLNCHLSGARSASDA